MRTKRKWTAQEHCWLINLVNQDKTDREIAERLKRTYSAVHSRAFYFKLRTRPKPVVVAPVPTVRICVAEVPEWYLLGWRFDGFIPGGICRMQWHSERPERRPVQVPELVAA